MVNEKGTTRCKWWFNLSNLKCDNFFNLTVLEFKKFYKIKSTLGLHLKSYRTVLEKQKIH